MTDRSYSIDERAFQNDLLPSEKPEIDSTEQIRNWKPFTRFALNQDTGGAIRGPGRADLFWGNGPYAEIAAGHMKHTGELFFLILNPDS